MGWAADCATGCINSAVVVARADVVADAVTSLGPVVVLGADVAAKEAGAAGTEAPLIAEAVVAGADA